MPVEGNESPENSIPSFLGEHPWTVSAWVKVRATCYGVNGKSSCGLKLCYATDQQVGSAGVPYWIPEGSVVVMWPHSKRRVYLAVDQGRGVESRIAARKGKGDHSAPVIDFCAPRQSWPDDIEVEIYQYVGSTPFQKLTRQQKEQTIAYAQRFIVNQ